MDWKPEVAATHWSAYSLWTTQKRKSISLSLKKKKKSLLQLFMYMAIYLFWLILKVKCTTYIKREDDSALGSHLPKNERWLSKEI